MENRVWHAEDIESVLESLETGRHGIGEEEARERLERYGPNELREERKTTPLELFLGQFKSILVIILILSAIVSAYISIRKGDPFTDTYVILFIVVMNAILGFVQEYRAEKAVEEARGQVAAARHGDTLHLGDDALGGSPKGHHHPKRCVEKTPDIGKGLIEDLHPIMACAEYIPRSL